MNEEAPPLTPAEKRSAAARARWDVHAHPLFPAEPGERAVAIAWIQLRRYGENGPVDHQRVWPAAELQGQDDIFSMFGGGVYELWGRAALPNGTPGAIVKKVRLALDGPPKPFAGQAQANAMAAAGAERAQSNGGGDRFDFMLQMMAEDRREARAREERREREAREERDRQQARDEARQQQMTAMMVQGLQVAAGIVSAIITRPPPPPPAPGPDLMPLVAALIPKPDNADPLDKLAKVLDIAKKVNPDKGATESLPELLGGLGQAMEGFAHIEGMRIQAAREGLLGGGAPLPGAPGAAPAQQSPVGHANGVSRASVGASSSPAPPSFEPPDDPAALAS